MDEPTLAEHRAAMTWAQRLKRVLFRASCPSPFGACLRRFKIAPGDLLGIDVETCPACGGAVRIIACIEDPVVIEKILVHLDAKAPEPEATRRPPCRAPPQRGLFD